MIAITTKEYGTLQKAFNFLSQGLFSNKLPDCLITFQRKAHTYGYFSHQRFKKRLGGAEYTDKIAPLGGAEYTDEIALNPAEFDRDDKAILSTLAHEMVHLWQAHYGKPSRQSYHNKEWADKMEQIGLMPSSTGQPGGKRTGQSVGHYIVEGGKFERWIKKFLDKYGGLNWQSIDSFNAKGKDKEKPKAKSKVKYTCGGCGLNAWGKPGLNLICGDCSLELQEEGEKEALPVEGVEGVEGVDGVDAGAVEKTGNKPAIETPDKTPFFLNIKELLPYLRRRWRGREEAVVTVRLPESEMYKEFRFSTYIDKKEKVRWYQWVLITCYGNIEKGEPDNQLHYAAAEMIGKIQDWFGVYFFPGKPVQYYDCQTGKLNAATVQAVGDTSISIKCDNSSDTIETEKGYLVTPETLNREPA